MSDVELLRMRPGLPVSNLELSIAFWTSIFGFTVTHVDPESRFALLKGGGAELSLIRQEEAPAGQTYLYVRGLDELHSRCQEAGVEIMRPLNDWPWGLRDFVLRSPGGHMVGIAEEVDRAPTEH